MRLHASRTEATPPAGAGPCQKADFAGGPNHINGVFAADIMRFQGIFAAAFEFARKRRLSRCLAGVFA
jgi:hypothetical protein